jgi:hypothetical protein
VLAIARGAQDRMHDEAVSGWLNSFLDGKNTFLLAGSNEEAARLARLARERLAALGKISGADEIVLSDGNAAGAGNRVRARLNTKIDASGVLERLANAVASGRIVAPPITRITLDDVPGLNGRPGAEGKTVIAFSRRR